MPDLLLPANDFLQILTFSLFLSLIGTDNNKQRCKILSERVVSSWTAYETAAMTLLRSLKLEITEANLHSTVLKFGEMQNDANTGIGRSIHLAMESIFKFSILEAPKENTLPKTVSVKLKDITLLGEKQVFVELRLMKCSSITIFATALSANGPGPDVSPYNLLELYSDSKSGFSIRSLKLKIFKWPLATFLIVSGKRLNLKTMKTNRRHMPFDSECTRCFRSNGRAFTSWSMRQRHHNVRCVSKSFLGPF